MTAGLSLWVAVRGGSEEGQFMTTCRSRRWRRRNMRDFARALGWTMDAKRERGQVAFWKEGAKAGLRRVLSTRDLLNGGEWSFALCVCVFVCTYVYACVTGWESFMVRIRFSEN